jgi:hypothetical protein
LGEEEKVEDGAGMPVTHFDDPRSGGHLALGVSKAPPGPAREGSRVIVHVVGALHLADGKYASVESYSPISNGLTAVVGAKTRSLIG